MAYEVIKTFTSPGYGTRGLAWDGMYLWANDSIVNTIYQLDTDGNVISSFAHSLPHNFIMSLTWDGMYLWATERWDDKIYQMNMSGNTVASFSSPGTDPRGLAWDGTNLWHTDIATGMIYQLDTSGNIISSFASPGTDPQGLAWGGNCLWYTDIATGMIYQLKEAERISTNLLGTAIVSANAKSITMSEASMNLISTATVSINAESEESDYTIGSVDMTATANITTKPYIIANANTDITSQSTLNVRPYIIANASASITGQALMYVRALRLIIPEGAYEITANDYFTKNQPADSSSVANYIIVETQPLVPGEVEELFSTNDPRTIEAGETIVINAEYSSKPAMNCSAGLSDNSANTTITKANFYACSAEIEITNEGTSQDSFNLVINGTALEVSGVEKAYSQDDRSITENGKITYELPENHLIQTKAMAQTIADKLKDSFADPKRDVSLDWRGNPALILADLATVPEFQKLGINKIGQFYVTKQELEYSGGLRANLEGRKNE